MKPHKHAQWIKAWADGHVIQFQLIDGSWKDIRENHEWLEGLDYRVKPKFNIGDKVIYNDTVMEVCFLEWGDNLNQYKVFNQYDCFVYEDQLEPYDERMDKINEAFDKGHIIECRVTGEWRDTFIPDGSTSSPPKHVSDPTEYRVKQNQYTRDELLQAYNDESKRVEFWSCTDRCWISVIDDLFTLKPSHYVYRIINKPKFKIGDAVEFTTCKGKYHIHNVSIRDGEYSYSVKDKYGSIMFPYYEYELIPYTEPELEPFTFDDAEMLIGKTVKDKKRSDYIYLITSVYRGGVKMNESFYSFIHLMEYYIFLDGSPCGKEVRR